MQNRPQLLFGQARLHLLLHHPHGVLAGDDGGPHHLDLLSALDRPGDLHHLTAVEQLEAVRLQRLHRVRAGPVDGDPPVAIAAGVDQISQLGGPLGEVAGPLVAGQFVHPLHRRTDLIDQLQVQREKVEIRVVEQDHRPVCRHPEVTRRVVGCPQAHVGGVGRIADVNRVVEHDPRIIELDQALLHPAEPVAADLVEVGYLDAGRGELCQRQVPRAERVPVEGRGPAGFLRHPLVGPDPARRARFDAGAHWKSAGSISVRRRAM